MRGLGSCSSRWMAPAKSCPNWLGLLPENPAKPQNVGGQMVFCVLKLYCPTCCLHDCTSFHHTAKGRCMSTRPCSILLGLMLKSGLARCLHTDLSMQTDDTNHPV